MLRMRVINTYSSKNKPHGHEWQSLKRVGLTFRQVAIDTDKAL